MLSVVQLLPYFFQLRIKKKFNCNFIEELWKLHKQIAFYLFIKSLLDMVVIKIYYIVIKFFL